MKSATGPFEGFDAYDDKWFPSAIKYVSGRKKCNLSIICLILYNCVFIIIIYIKSFQWSYNRNSAWWQDIQ